MANNKNEVVKNEAVENQKKNYNFYFDFLFKKVFGNSWALAILFTLIWSIKGKKVEVKPQDITYLDHRIQEHHEQKEIIQDIYVKVKMDEEKYSNIYVDVEMQNKISEMSYSRLLEDLYHIGIKNIVPGESYGNSRTELICFLHDNRDEKFIKKGEWIATKLLKDEQTNEFATDEVKISFIKLKNLNKSHIIELEYSLTI